MPFFFFFFFTLQDVNWWTGVVWITYGYCVVTCGLLSNISHIVSSWCHRKLGLMSRFLVNNVSNFNLFITQSYHLASENLKYHAQGIWTSFACFLKLESLQLHEKSAYNQYWKSLLLCSMGKMRCGTAWGWINDDSLYFQVNYSFRVTCLSKLLSVTLIKLLCPLDYFTWHTKTQTCSLIQQLSKIIQRNNCPKSSVSNRSMIPLCTANLLI